MKLAISQKTPAQWSQAGMIGILREIETQVNLLSEGRLQGQTLTATAAPTTGEYARGDFVRNSAPTAGGVFGWVCVSAPLTFKTVVISA